MPSKPHISIRSGWRCIDDGPHDWRTEDQFRRDGKRCNRCECTEGALRLWLITAHHPEHGVIQKHCDSFAAALEVANRKDPINSLFDGLTIRFGYELYAA